MMNQQREKFENLLQEWDTQWRMRRLMRYLPRVLMVSMGAGILIGAVVGLLGLLPPVAMVILVAFVVVLMSLLLAGVLRFYGEKGMAVALRFDHLFDLQERISTALELAEGRIKTVPEIAEYQLDDAYQRAREVDPKKKLKFEVPWLEWVGAAVTLVALVLIVGGLAYLNLRAMTTVSEATQAAIDGATDATRDITEQIALDSNLTDEEREMLLESAEQTLDELENPDISAEDAFVSMSELETDLREQADSIQDEILQQENALNQAAETLNMSSEDLEEQLGEWSDSIEEMSSEQQQSFADSLQEAADALENSYPELSESLQEAAENMNQGDMQGAQESLDSAQSQLQQANSEREDRQESADSLQEAAEQASQEASEIAESEASQMGESPQEGEQEGQEGTEGQDAPQEGPEGDGPQSGEGEGDNPDSSVAQEGEDGQPSDLEQPEAEEGVSGAGSGDNEGGEQTQDISDGADPTGGAENNPDGTGEDQYEQVFTGDGQVPNFADTSIELEADDSNQPSVEGDFQENPTGESIVPYNQVFGEYSDSANQALANAYVPLGVRDVVRDYFTSIEPTGDGE